MSPLFRYHTRDAEGVGRDGTIEALNEDDVVKKLQEQGLIVISVEMTGTGKPEIVKEEVPNIPVEEKQHGTTKKCPYCAEEIQYDAVKCRYCGEMLKPTQIPNICPKCGKEYSGAIKYCPVCIITLEKKEIDARWDDKEKEVKIENGNISQVKCPKCGCASITTTKKGYDAGGACCGAALFGPLGLLCGATDANKLSNVCQKCGHSWELK